MTAALISSAAPLLPARQPSGRRALINELVGLIFNALMNHSSKSKFQSPFGAREVKLTVVSCLVC